MNISKIFAFASLVVFTWHANADPIAKLTFDMSFNGYTTMNGQFQGYFTDPSKPIHDTIVLTLPFTVRNIQTYNDSYANNYVMNFGDTGQSAGIKITSGEMDTIFSGAEYKALVEKDLKELGVTSLSPSTNTPSPRDYAFLGKRDVHGAAVEQQYYTWLDMSTQVTQHATGIDNADFLSMVRINGGIFGQPGNITPFSLSDVPKMLLEIDDKKSPGFAVSYTSFVDTFSTANGAWTGRPLEVLYQGNGKLTGFTIDGVNQIPSAVPEPATYAMFLAGLFLLGFINIRRRS